MMLIFNAIRTLKVYDYGESMRLDIGTNARVLIKFVALNEPRSLNFL